MIRDRKRQFDHRRHDDIQEKGFVGASEVTFVGSDTTVWCIIAFYKTTPGLYQLVFKNNPKKYTEEDLYIYQTVVMLADVTFILADKYREQDHININR
jgi:hypothetical protein